MKWKRGFRRITFVLAIVAAVICAGLTVSIVISKHNSAQSYLRHKQELYKNRPKWMDDPIISEKPEGLINRLEELVPKATAKELKELEKGFWVNLSRRKLVGLCVSAGLGAAVITYCGIWLIYYFVEWLILGFCEDNPKDQQKQ